MSYPFNAFNRGVYIADNLAFLRQINDESVDLVNIDPPFGKSRTWPADKFKPPLTEDELDNELRLLASWGIATPQQAMAAGLEWPPDSPLKGGYSDIWSWADDIHEQWVEDLQAGYPAVHSLIETTRLVHGDSIAAYLCYMAVRVIEIHRILAPTGSLFTHCDHTAGAYLRQLLDAVFGKDQFRNEIVWCYTGPANTRRWFPRKHDTILFYAKTERARFLRDDIRVPYSENFRTRRRYTEGSAGITSGYSEGRSVAEVSGTFGAGKVPEDWWSDIPGGGQISRNELTGYPTQKPVALAERIIQASTNEGDIVLDCFAGCAYTAIAAERLGRQWTAVDWNPRAWTVFKRQFNKPSLALLTCHDLTTGQQVLGSEPTVTVHGPRQLPQRQSPVREEQLQPLSTPARQYKEKALMSNDEMLAELLRLSGWTAWCCGFANRRPDGAIVKTTRNFHLDHIDPVSRGGINDLMNRAPMCPYHNIRKSDRLVSLREYRNQIADAGELMVSSFRDLIDLGSAQVQTAQIYARRLVQRRPQEVLPPPPTQL